ncbi:transglutaminase domain-containing protein [Methanogenium organophilum]|uniref:Transglutaminase-like domain-containing protein n=1 Tax=Methanogenium organophilum TaxID=2199 RepID=A0A9X9S278_METOG|nr:transglutaminase domain-containing protein [Methanogenium organophilum]WAI00391.1 hypothetical protein OU421_08095 [Methanogenium organophilum]
MSGNKDYSKDSILSYWGAVVMILAVFFIGSLYGMITQSQISSEHINEYFDILYETEIYSHGEEEIGNFISSLPSNESEQERLERIALWVTSNFTNINWETNIRGNSEYDYSNFGPGMNRYVYDPSGRLRVYPPSSYANNPQWIAYYKTGACGELATLFSEIANRTGTPSHVVAANFYGGNNHAWVEITRENGDLWVFDPTMYGEYMQGQTVPYGAWFTSVERWNIPWEKDVTYVYIAGTHEEITCHYPSIEKSMEVRMMRIQHLKSIL